MVRVEASGENPTSDLPEGNDGMRLKGFHQLDAYAFEEGKWHGLIVFNYGLRQARRLSLKAPGLKSNVKLWRIISSGPGASNEAAAEVKIVEEKFGGADLALPPCSMAVLEWQD
jgi:hypothetical protein